MVKEREKLIMAIAAVTVVIAGATVMSIQGKTSGEGMTCIQIVDAFQAGIYNGPMRDGLPACVLEIVPEEPPTFGAISSMIATGDLRMETFCTALGEDFYLNPKFYKNYGAFLDSYVNPIRSADGTLRRGTYGYGSYISELIASVEPGDSFSTCVMVYTAPFMSTFQSMAFEANAYTGEGSEVQFAQSHFPDGSNGTGSEDANGYFKVSVSPNYLLLEPAYPVFYRNWTQRVRIDVETAEGTPKGNYMVVISPTGELPPGIDAEWSWEHLTNYIRATGFYQNILMIGVEVR